MDRRPIYLDHNATAPLRREAKEVLVAALAETGNPSSVHGFGRRARRLVEDAREAVARLVNARPADVVFTASGSEANNLALRGAGRETVFVSAIEHPSVLWAAGAGARLIPVGRSGVVDLAALEAMLAGAAGPALVSVMLANNETGVLQPVAAVAALARAHGALVHADAVQAAGRIPVDFAALGVDLMTVSAHKLGGPLGAAALVVSERVALVPGIAGGGQERGRRAGTENVPAIAGFGAAARAAAAEVADPALSPWPRVAALRQRIEHGLGRAHPDLVVFGREAERLPNTLSFALPGLSAETAVMALDLAGIAVSAGAACSSGKVSPSHVLAAMGAGPELAGAAIRVSLGPGNDEADVGRFLATWGAFAERALARPSAA
ncbi:MAG: cysteine desulfurase [Proteobacteria bacterium]|nr:cysteine desulfurase [Pseudomonadota bacterium]